MKIFFFFFLASSQRAPKVVNPTFAARNPAKSTQNAMIWMEIGERTKRKSSCRTLKVMIVVMIVFCQRTRTLTSRVLRKIMLPPLCVVLTAKKTTSVCTSLDHPSLLKRTAVPAQPTRCVVFLSVWLALFLSGGWRCS